MIDNSLSTVWTALQHDSAKGQTVSRRIPSASDRDLFIYVTAGQPRRKGLHIKAAGVAGDLRAKLPEVRGLRLQVMEDPGTGKASILVEESATAVASLFESLVSDVLDATVTRPPGSFLADVCQRLSLWQDFFMTNSSTLTLNQQAGLVAEVDLLQEVLVPQIGIDNAARSWFGPERALQDFSDGRLSIEVKSTSATGPQTVSIANERQLQALPEALLLLACYRLDRRTTGPGLSLPTAVGALRALVEGNEAAERLIEAKLIRAGYSDKHAHHYETKFAVRSREWFRVENGFPRITENDLTSGITNVSYKLNLEACEPWKLTPEEANVIIRSEYAGA